MFIDSHFPPTASDSYPVASIPIDPLMTRREVAQFLRITERCLSSHRETWKKILPRIVMEDSNIVRYRRSDVIRLIERGYQPCF